MLALSSEKVLTLLSWLIAVALVITIFSLALEPFVQQISLFRNKETFPPSNVSIIRRANDAKIVVGANPLLSDWQRPIQGYVMRGVLSNYTSAFNPTCPSGKCTWKEFDSLGKNLPSNLWCCLRSSETKPLPISNNVPTRLTEASQLYVRNA